MLFYVETCVLQACYEIRSHMLSVVVSILYLSFASNLEPSSHENKKICFPFISTRSLPHQEIHKLSVRNVSSDEE